MKEKVAERPLRVGLVGFGYAGATFHAPLIEATAGFHLAAVASSQPDKVHKALARPVEVCSAIELIARPDIDLVVVATPNDSHHELASAALRAGRHVVVDKPFTVTVAEAQDLVELSRMRQRVLSVFHNRRWDSDFLGLRAVLSDRMVGRPIAFESYFDRYRPEVLDRWRESDQPGAGLWMDLGPHLLDQAVKLLGLPDSIALDRLRLREGAKADDHFRATLRWHTGTLDAVMGTLGASMVASVPRPRFMLSGTRGIWHVQGLDIQESQLRAGVKPGHDEWANDHRRGTYYPDELSQGTSMPLPRGDYRAYYGQVRDAIRGQATAHVTAEEGYVVQRLLEAGIASDATKAEVPLRW